MKLISLHTYPQYLKIADYLRNVASTSSPFPLVAPFSNLHPENSFGIPLATTITAFLFNYRPRCPLLFTESFVALSYFGIELLGYYFSMAQSSFKTAAALQHLIQGTTPVISFGHSNSLANLSVLYPSFKTEVVTLKDDGGLVSACIIRQLIRWYRGLVGETSPYNPGVIKGKSRRGDHQVQAII
ncbi:Vacuolar protein sorting-associated protein 36 [Fusarium oxysporum f. sp. albedinis]|nr:Vacuolar protein sorting-associated protein 36 [Fusarium oxysporum f. sp. albedinis]